MRRVKKTLGKSDHLFFLIGMDAFQDIAKWHQAEELLGECDFIVAARPGFSLADVASSLPEKLRPPPAVTKLFRKQKMDWTAGVCRALTLHMLPETHENISATQIRAAVDRGGALKRLLTVADYIVRLILTKKGRVVKHRITACGTRAIVGRTERPSKSVITNFCLCPRLAPQLG